MARPTGLQMSVVDSVHILDRQCTLSPRVASEISFCSVCSHPIKHECGDASCAAVPIHDTAGLHCFRIEEEPQHCQLDQWLEAEAPLGGQDEHEAGPSSETLRREVGRSYYLVILDVECSGSSSAFGGTLYRSRRVSHLHSVHSFLKSF